MRFALQISYFGERYSGWQKQPNANSVQQEVETALSKLLKTPIWVVGCGRTDAGVHAKCYWLNFDYEAIEDGRLLIAKLNGILPNDISANKIVAVLPNFSSRFDAISREYRYFIHQNHNPFLFGRSYYLSRELNISLMNQACEIIKSYTDFGSFQKSGSGNRTSHCIVSKAIWYQLDEQLVFEVEANRFLRNMVRAMVGTLLNLGLGRITLSEFEEILQKGDRRYAGKSVPACGLYLWRINYNHLEN